MRVLLVMLSLLISIRPALAHEGGAVPTDVWTHWNTDPLLLTLLLLPALLFVRGAATYRIRLWRVAAFTAGIVTILIALISPLDAVSHALFSAHMAQHLLLMMVAAPLLVIAVSLPPILRGLPGSWRRSVGRLLHGSVVDWLWHWLKQPLIAVILHVVALVVWHVPALYELALRVPLVHALEHVSFFATAALFWWVIARHQDHGVRLLAVFVVMMISGLLGALMTFTMTPWYGSHLALAGAWGLTGVQDQQLAGLLMWIPTGFIYIIVAGWLIADWLNAVERRVSLREQSLTKETHYA